MTDYILSKNYHLQENFNKSIPSKNYLYLMMSCYPYWLNL